MEPCTYRYSIFNRYMKVKFTTEETHFMRSAGNCIFRTLRPIWVPGREVPIDGSRNQNGHWTILCSHTFRCADATEPITRCFTKDLGSEFFRPVPWRSRKGIERDGMNASSVSRQTRLCDRFVPLPHIPENVLHFPKRGPVTPKTLYWIIYIIFLNQRLPPDPREEFMLFAHARAFIFQWMGNSRFKYCPERISVITSEHSNDQTILTAQ